MAWGCLLLFSQELQGLQHFKYDVARQVSEPHKSAKFHGLVLFSLLVTRVEFKEEEEGEDEDLWENTHFLFNPFPMHEYWVSGVF